MIRGDCPGSFQPAKPDLTSFATVGTCPHPECGMVLAVDKLGRMRAHKLPSQRQLERRREYLAYKQRNVSEQPHEVTP
jgi:hypothetical protein